MGVRHAGKWPDEALDDIRMRYVRGDSAGMIAKALSGVYDGRALSRNAVIGLVHRNGWADGRGSFGGAARKPIVAKRKQDMAPRLPKDWTGRAPVVRKVVGREPVVREPQTLRLVTTAEDQVADGAWGGADVEPLTGQPVTGQPTVRPVGAALVGILDLGPDMCRFIEVEHGGQAFYCGQPADVRVDKTGHIGTRSWCACHRRRVFTRVPDGRDAVVEQFGRSA